MITMDILLDLVMFILPACFASAIHGYLCNDNLWGLKICKIFMGYLFTINMLNIGIAAFRGIWGLDFSNMTITYKVKYISLGLAFGIVLPFLVCIFTEKLITLKGILRYIRRMVHDFHVFFPYAIRSANAELHVEVANSFLNWMWWLIEPLCMMLIYTLIFGVVFNASEKYFPIFIFIGLAMWSFFRRGIDSSVTIIRSNRAIITKVYIPKYILYLSRLLVYGFKMLVSFGVVIVMMFFFKVPVTIHVLSFVPIILILFLMTFGIGTILMHYGVYVNDLAYITGIILTMLMYMTGVFYNVAKRIPEPYGELLERFNPIAFLISAMRSSLLYGQAPNWGDILFWTAVSIVVSMLGVFTIYHNENAYVKVI